MIIHDDGFFLSLQTKLNIQSRFTIQNTKNITMADLQSQSIIPDSNHLLANVGILLVVLLARR